MWTPPPSSRGGTSIPFLCPSLFCPPEGGRLSCHCALVSLYTAQGLKTTVGGDQGLREIHLFASLLVGWFGHQMNAVTKLSYVFINYELTSFWHKITDPKLFRAVQQLLGCKGCSNGAASLMLNCCSQAWCTVPQSNQRTQVILHVCTLHMVLNCTIQFRTILNCMVQFRMVSELYQYNSETLNLESACTNTACCVMLIACIAHDVPLTQTAHMIMMHMVAEL